MELPERYLDFAGPDEIRVKGHRVWIEHVLVPHLNQGLGPEELGAWFPTLSADEIGAVLAYYRQHRPEVDAYLRRVGEQQEAAFLEAERNPSPAMRRIRGLRKLASEGMLASETLRRG